MRAFACVDAVDADRVVIVHFTELDDTVVPGLRGVLVFFRPDRRLNRKSPTDYPAHGRGQVKGGALRAIDRHAQPWKLLLATIAPGVVSAAWIQIMHGPTEFGFHQGTH